MMKNPILKYLLVTSALLASGGCGKDFGDINVDPNNPREVPADLLLIGAEKLLAEHVYCGLGDNIRGLAFAELLSQAWAQNNYTEITRYLIRGEETNGLYRHLYAGVLMDLADIERILLEKPGLDPLENGNKLAVARVLRVYTLQLLSDMFGPIPYGEALHGASDRTPAYVSQREVYFSLIGELKAAIQIMDVGHSGFGPADMIYQGDMQAWSRFAHALMIRIALRMADVEPDSSRVLFEKFAAGAFSSVDHNACFRFLANAPNNSPLHQQYIERGATDQGLSNILIDKTLKPLNDPRLAVWAEPAANTGAFAGRPYGQTADDAASDEVGNYSLPSGAGTLLSGSSQFNQYDVMRPDFSACLLSYSEQCFSFAEAAERGWSAGASAASWYTLGIEAALAEWGITDPETISTFLSQDAVRYESAPGTWQQKIGVQKWLALFMQGFQAWSEWRRLDFDKLEAPVGGMLIDLGSAVAPLRLVFPGNEQSLNAPNYQQALQLLGGPDALNTRVWWDVK